MATGRHPGCNGNRGGAELVLVGAADRCWLVRSTMPCRVPLYMMNAAMWTRHPGDATIFRNWDAALACMVEFGLCRRTNGEVVDVVTLIGALKQ